MQLLFNKNLKSSYLKRLFLFFFKILISNGVSFDSSFLKDVIFIINTNHCALWSSLMDFLIVHFKKNVWRDRMKSCIDTKNKNFLSSIKRKQQEDKNFLKTGYNSRLIDLGYNFEPISLTWFFQICWLEKLWELNCLCRWSCWGRLLINYQRQKPN